jgi:hypothetical protein
MYFFDETETDRGAIPAEVAVVLQDDAVRDLALRAAGLSERSLKAISAWSTAPAPCRRSMADAVPARQVTVSNAWQASCQSLGFEPA